MHVSFYSDRLNLALSAGNFGVINAEDACTSKRSSHLLQNTLSEILRV